MNNSFEALLDENLYFPDMEKIDSDICSKVMTHFDSYNPTSYSAEDVKKALAKDSCSIEDFKALLSPAALPFLEAMAKKSQKITARHFGNSVYFFTPLYLSNYCENQCVYCGFNCKNSIKRKKLTLEQMEQEMAVIAQSGMEEILLLTGESPTKTPIQYIGEACKIAKKYFRAIGLEIYPVNTAEYSYLQSCGADYVTVFQETYDISQYKKMHLKGKKQIWHYRFNAQERALQGGMRGVAFSSLFGLSDFRKDALASALHVYYLQKKYPQGEFALSCPRLRPITTDVHFDSVSITEKDLCQILCAYRIFLHFVGITVSSRESSEFRNGIVKIAATKISAGVSTGIGDHKEKYAKIETLDSAGDEQFEIQDSRSLDEMHDAFEKAGLQPVLNEYLYV